MASPRLPNSLLPLSLLLLFTVHHSITLSSATRLFPAFSTVSDADYAGAAASPTTNPIDFIRSSCNATLYPAVCYTTLSRYADMVQQDRAHLARVAIGVSLVQTHKAEAHFSNLTQRADYGPDPRAASALRDCRSTFSDAVDQMRQSLKQMKQLGLESESESESGSKSEEEVRFELSNVQTWMSAALTNEDTCSDGFDNVAEGQVKEEVCEKVAEARELTSNALALVNSYAASVSS